MGAENKRPSRHAMCAVCGEIGSEDGVDPGGIARKSGCDQKKTAETLPGLRTENL